MNNVLHFLTRISAWVAAYLFCIVLLAGLMLAYRPILLARFGQPHVAASWDNWRSAAKRSSGVEGPVQGPVQRKTPKSAEPPGVILLRDYFPTMLAAGLFFPSLLFFFTAFVVRGMAKEALVKRQNRGEKAKQSMGDAPTLR